MPVLQLDHRLHHADFYKDSNNNNLRQETTFFPTTIAAGTCPSGYVVQGNFCVPTATTTQQQTTTPTVCTTPNAILTPIIANAGPSQTVSQSSLVTLSAAGSTHSTVINDCITTTGTITTYNWIQTSGSMVNLTASTSQTPTFIAPKVSATLAFSLTITDNLALKSTPAVVTVIVS